MAPRSPVTLPEFPRTQMQAALLGFVGVVHQNIRLGLTDTYALEEAIAMFRIARCVLPSLEAR